MIVAERKPLKEIFAALEPYVRVCIIGCGTCVTVCHAGGEKEVREMASILSLCRRKEGLPLEVTTRMIERQCEYEFVDKLAEDLKEELKDCAVILSLGCGVGVQTLAERLPKTHIFPGLNTMFKGLPVNQGVWEERCLGCGDCNLGLTCGVCPITRCSKSMLNGPCGGSQNGKCEIDQNLDCGWQLIYDRLEQLGKLELMDELQPPKDWSKAHYGGPRRILREDIRI